MSHATSEAPGYLPSHVFPQVPQCAIVSYTPSLTKPSSIVASQSLSAKSQTSSSGSAASQIHPLSPMQRCTPSQVPYSFVFEHTVASRPSSASPSQSLSSPSQVSADGVAALQPVQVPPAHVSQPGHSPCSLIAAQVRLSPSAAASQVHDPPSGQHRWVPAATSARQE